MISNIVKDMRQGALWHMWQNRKCPPMETVSWKILHVSSKTNLYLPFSCPVCICENWGAFNRFANSHKPQKHWQQSENKKNNIPRVNPRFHSFFGSNLFYCPLITLLSHPWITLNPTVEVSNWGLRAKRISDKMAKRAVSCTWATVEGVLMGAVFRGRSTLQAEFLNPWASQLEQSYCALQGLLDLNRKHPKSMKFLLDSRVSCVCWSRLLYHSEKEHAYTMQYSHSPANFMRFPLKSQNYFYHPG